MKRIPKYTSQMFKKKMPKYGASSIRMPRMPKAPVKKLAEGGGVRGGGCEIRGKTRGKMV